MVLSHQPFGLPMKASVTMLMMLGTLSAVSAFVMGILAYALSSWVLTLGFIGGLLTAVTLWNEAERS